MAENHPDDLDALMDVSAADKPQSGDETAEAALVHGPSDESEKDNPENAQLQAEVAGSGENNVAFDGEAAAPAPPQSANVDKKFEKLLLNLEDAKRAAGELMAWKEDMRLLAMHHNTLGPYYDNWTKEANLFFRRLVIINKRLETLRKKKRA
ncbi:MAG TPA: hypothetical protein VE954_02970 [Oligoflexus sp.]|uniref:hypothetical protein n=1 Tax=Oligoflexus sp. TaxID=1971216 RepID=UPI002D70BC20|nr:hypothetical protein [Oligoflexus sp.]HYX32049.1 hypothetical protein [Oligoflexus sp.]